MVSGLIWSVVPFLTYEGQPSIGREPRYPNAKVPAGLAKCGDYLELASS
jgi:hypothetical protein